MVKPEDFLQAPVPGQSLTATPKQYKWERPPQMDNPEDAVKYYIDKLANQDVMDDLAVMFDGGMPITPLVQTLTTTAVSEGLHSIDTSLIVSPVIHAFIKASMLQYGIDAKDDTYDANKDPTERENSRLRTAIQLALAEAKNEDRTAATDKGVAVLEEVRAGLNEEPMQEDAPLEEAMPPVMNEDTPEPSMGLMARETM